MISNGYEISKDDKCVFRKLNGKKITIVMVHVDDIMILSNAESDQNNIKENLSKVFGIKTFQEDNVNYLGMNIRLKDGIRINQKAYINKLLDKYGRNKIIAANTPSNNDLYVSTDEEPALDKDLFRSQVMSLMYLSKRSRPDILKETAYLTTRITMCTREDEKKLGRIFGYLLKTIDIELVLNPDDLCFGMWADSSYNIYYDSKGQSGIKAGFGKHGGLIFVKSTKQKLVARSSCESELICAEEATCIGLWLLRMLNFMGVKQDSFKLYQDNKAAILIGNKGFNSDATNRHMRNRFYFIKQCVDDKLMELNYLNTEEMDADYFTKPLIGKRFYKLRDRIMGN